MKKEHKRRKKGKMVVFAVLIVVILAAVAIVVSRNAKKEESSYSFELKLNGANPCVLLCLEEGKEYTFETSGTVKKVNKATFAIGNFKDKKEKVSVTW